MFDRFTDRARKVMGLSREEALRFDHDHIGVEHILLGLILEGSGVAAEILKELDVDPKRVRLEVERLMTPGNTMVTMGQLPFTRRAKKVLEFALEEAAGLGHNYIGTEHLLVGLIREEDGIAAQVLRRLHVRLEDVRERVLDLLDDGQSNHEEEEGSPGSLTFRAQLAMDRASLLALVLRHGHVGTGHILLGLVDEGTAGSGLARLLLRRVRDETEKLLPPGDAEPHGAAPPLAPDAKAAMDLAIEAAGRAKVDVGHLLVGLLREKEGIAARVLAAAGIREEDALAEVHWGVNRLRDAVRDALGQEPEPRSEPGRAGLFDRFTDRSRIVMGRARQAAQRFNHDCIGTEHLLLGLLAPDGRAAALVRQLGVDPAAARATIEKLLAPGGAPMTTGQVPFTLGVKRALELSLEEANALGHEEIREEHLLLGLLREEKGTAARVLASLGLDPEAVRKAIAGPPTPPN